MRAAYAFRDRVVCAICNWLLTNVASERYGAMVGGSIKYGLRAAANDRWTPDAWDDAYNEAMQTRDWQTCEQLSEEREHESWWRSEESITPRSDFGI